MGQAQGAWDPGLERPSFFHSVDAKGGTNPQGIQLKEDLKRNPSRSFWQVSLSSCASLPASFLGISVFKTCGSTGRTPCRCTARAESLLPRAPAHTLVCWDPEGRTAASWLRPEGAGLAAGPLSAWPLFSWLSGRLLRQLEFLVLLFQEEVHKQALLPLDLVADVRGDVRDHQSRDTQEHHQVLGS